MSEASREKAPTPEEFFGETVAEWRLALNAAHAFAQASRCLAGDDVIAWLDERTKAFQQACLPPPPSKAMREGEGA